MKSLICSLLLLIGSFGLKAQYPIQQNLGAASTLVKNPNYGGIQGGIIPYTFVDTTAANTALTYLKTYNGALIYTSGDSSLWFRSGGASKWTQVLPSGGGTALNAWTTRGNDLSGQSLPNRLGTINGDELNIITDNTIQMVIPAVGITRNSGAANKYLTIDTVAKTLYYNEAVGTTPTWQQTLTAGSTLTGNNTVDGGGYTFQFENANQLLLSATDSAYFSGSKLTLIGITSGSSIRITADSIDLHPPLGKLIIDTLLNNTSQNTLIGWRQGAGQGDVGYLTVAGSLSLAAGVLTGTGITGLTIGTTPITSGTTTRVLYDNAGVVGEYTTVPLANGGTGSTDGSGLPYWKLAGTNTLTADVNNTGFNVGFDVLAPKAQVHTTSFAAGYLKVITDNYVILATDYTLSVDNGANNWTILLPEASTASIGRIYIIKRFDDNSTGTITIDADGSNVQSPTAGTFAATQVLAAWGDYSQSVMFQSNGTDWEAIK